MVTGGCCSTVMAYITLVFIGLSCEGTVTVANFFNDATSSALLFYLPQIRVERGREHETQAANGCDGIAPMTSCNCG